MVFPIDTSMVENTSELTSRDIGKWCFYINGSLVGFFRTRVEAETAFGQTLN
tara:strand:- start:815 stop:970 length:156 start_codon:yes stop_codon:yes gene_type:complete